MACSVGGMSLLQVGAIDAGLCLEIPSIARVLDSLSGAPRREITISSRIIGEHEAVPPLLRGRVRSSHQSSARARLG